MRVGERIWHSARITKDNAEIAEYSKPTEIRTRFNYFTVMPASSLGYMEVMKYGEDVDSTWIAIANANYFRDLYGFELNQSILSGGDVLSLEKVQKFVKVGDLFWLDGERPMAKLESEYGIGSTATAVVKSVSFVNHSISIILTRNKDKVVQ